jgi:hypothetical protein
MQFSVFAQSVIIIVYIKLSKSHSYLCFRLKVLPMKARTLDIEGSDSEDRYWSKIRVLECLENYDTSRALVCNYVWCLRNIAVCLC